MKLRNRLLSLMTKEAITIQDDIYWSHIEYLIQLQNSFASKAKEINFFTKSIIRKI